MTTPTLAQSACAIAVPVTSTPLPAVTTPVASDFAEALAACSMTPTPPAAVTHHALAHHALATVRATPVTATSLTTTSLTTAPGPALRVVSAVVRALTPVEDPDPVPANPQPAHAVHEAAAWQAVVQRGRHVARALCRETSSGAGGRDQPGAVDAPVVALGPVQAGTAAAVIVAVPVDAGTPPTAVAPSDGQAPVIAPTVPVLTSGTPAPSRIEAPGPTASAVHAVPVVPAVQAVPAVSPAPAAPGVPAAPAVPAVPAASAAPAVPALQAVPAIGALPAGPAGPAIPAVAAVPAVQAVPAAHVVTAAQPSDEPRPSPGVGEGPTAVRAAHDPHEPIADPAPASGQALPAAPVLPTLDRGRVDLVPGAGASASGSHRLPSPGLSDVAGLARALRAQGGGRSSLVLRLDPPELGAVLVRLTVQDGRVDVQLRTPDLAAKGHLQAASYDVGKVLREQGLDLGSFDVAHGDVLAGQQDRGEQRREQPERATRHPFTRADGAVSTPRVTDDVTTGRAPRGTWL